MNGMPAGTARMLLPAVDLPLFNQNQGPIARAWARREQAAARFTALQTRIIDSLDGAAALYRAANQTLATADSLLNGEQDRERQTLRMFEGGEIDRATLLSVQLERIAAEECRSSMSPSSSAGAGRGRRCASASVFRIGMAGRRREQSAHRHHFLSVDRRRLRGGGPIAAQLQAAEARRPSR